MALQLAELEVLIAQAKHLLRDINDPYIPETAKLAKLGNFFTQVIQQEIHSFAEEDIFRLLCDDINSQCIAFLNNPLRTVEEGKRLCILLLSMSTYLKDDATAPWTLGLKLDHSENARLKRILLTVFHDAGTPRGQLARVILTGSLARGYSDYKHLANIPKPVDYDLPKAYRDHIEREIGVHEQLKMKFSDVDLVIINAATYRSIPEQHRKLWVVCGEKYSHGVYGSPILSLLHQKLSRQKIGGISGRLINFLVCENIQAYDAYNRDRIRQFGTISAQTGHPISSEDVVILNQVIQ